MRAALTGCALTREPLRTPELPLPDALPAVTGAAVPDLPDPWWTLFDDPTLDALLREALTRNTDVMIAAARVDEARALAGIVDADRLPTLNLEADATRSRVSRLERAGCVRRYRGDPRTMYTVRGAVGYEVDLWGRYAHASTAARGKAIAERINPAHEDDYWRSEFPTRPYAASAQHGWEDYRPAYRIGYERYPEYHGRRFDEVESEFARDWEHERGESRLSWDEARQATRDAYERVAGSIERAIPGDTDQDGK